MSHPRTFCCVFYFPMCSVWPSFCLLFGVSFSSGVSLIIVISYPLLVVFSSQFICPVNYVDTKYMCVVPTCLPCICLYVDLLKTMQVCIATPPSSVCIYPWNHDNKYTNIGVFAKDVSDHGAVRITKLSKSRPSYLYKKQKAFRRPSISSWFVFIWLESYYFNKWCWVSMQLL